MTPERIYKILLNFYPREFRQEYGQEMTRVFQENLKHEGSSFGFWARIFWDVISSASRERIIGGLDMQNAWVKIGGVAAITHGLFLPLLMLVITLTNWQPEMTTNADANLIYISLINFVVNGLPLGLIVLGVYFHRATPHTRLGPVGFMLSMTCILLILLQNFVLFAPRSYVPISSVQTGIYMFIRFGFPVSLALIGSVYLTKTGIRHAPIVSRLLIGIAAVLIISSVSERLFWAMFPLGEMNQFVWIFFLIERLAWLPLAWIMLNNQKPITPSRAQPA